MARYFDEYLQILNEAKSKSKVSVVRSRITAHARDVESRLNIKLKFVDAEEINHPENYGLTLEEACIIFKVVDSKKLSRGAELMIGINSAGEFQFYNDATPLSTLKHSNRDTRVMNARLDPVQLPISTLTTKDYEHVISQIESELNEAVAKNIAFNLDHASYYWETTDTEERGEFAKIAKALKCPVKDVARFDNSELLSRHFIGQRENVKWLKDIFTNFDGEDFILCSYGEVQFVMIDNEDMTIFVKRSDAASLAAYVESQENTP